MKIRIVKLKQQQNGVMLTSTEKCCLCRDHVKHLSFIYVFRAMSTDGFYLLVTWKYVSGSASSVFEVGPRGTRGTCIRY